MSILMEVWGPMACFTRPEMKTERVSYDVPTSGVRLSWLSCKRNPHSLLGGKRIVS